MTFFNPTIDWFILFVIIFLCLRSLGTFADNIKKPIESFIYIILWFLQSLFAFLLFVGLILLIYFTGIYLFAVLFPLVFWLRKMMRIGEKELEKNWKKIEEEVEKQEEKLENSLNSGCFKLFYIVFLSSVSWVLTWIITGNPLPI